MLATLAPQVDRLAYFHHTAAKIGSAAVRISRTGYTGDLGFEIFVPADEALDVFDAVMDAPRKTYLDYPTYKRTFERLRPLFWALYKLDRVPKSFYVKFCHPLPPV